MPPELFIVISGICWIGVYVLLAKRGFQDKSYGMPLVPLSINIAWETVFSLIYPFGENSPARVILFIWLILDGLVLATFFLYGYMQFEKGYPITRFQFYIIGIFALVSAYAFFLTAPPFLLHFQFFKGSIFQVAIFLAYGVDNVGVSIFFVSMFLQRKSIEGQSFYIGLLKWIGTLIVAVWYVVENNYPFVWFIIAVIEVFDVLYLMFIYNALTKLRINPWLRF